NQFYNVIVSLAQICADEGTDEFEKVLCGVWQDHKRRETNDGKFDFRAVHTFTVLW
ncbi:unnamed protein product, partial [Choristocarpus tenellus]